MKIAIVLSFLALACLANASASINLGGIAGPSFGVAHHKPQPQAKLQPKPETEQLSEEQGDPELDVDREHDLIAQPILSHVRPGFLLQQEPGKELKPEPESLPETGRQQDGPFSEPHRPFWFPKREPQSELEREAELEPVQGPVRKPWQGRPHRRPKPKPELEAELESQSEREPESIRKAWQNHKELLHSHRHPKPEAEPVPELNVQTEFEQEPESVRKPWQNRPHRQPNPAPAPKEAPETKPEPVRESWLHDFIFSQHRPERYPQPEQEQMEEEEGEEEEEQVKEPVEGIGSAYVNALAKPSPFFVISNFHKLKTYADY